MRTPEKIRGRLLLAGLLLATLLVSGCGTGSAFGTMFDSWHAFFNDIGQQGDATAQALPAGASAAGGDPVGQMNKASTTGAPP